MRGQILIETTTVRTSPTIAALAKALSAAQGEMKNPPKDSVNPHFKSKYADLATVRDTVIPALSKNGLAVIQLPTEIGGEPALTTILTHSGGEFVESTMLLRPSKKDPQGVGSSLTYARRYSLQSMVGVAADDDDDANAATRRRDEAPPPRNKEERAAAKAAEPIIADTVFDLLTQWCELSGASFNVELNRLFTWLKAEASCLDDLKPRQLSDAARALTKKIADFKPDPAAAK